MSDTPDKLKNAAEAELRPRLLRPPPVPAAGDDSILSSEPEAAPADAATANGNVVKLHNALGLRAAAAISAGVIAWPL